MRHAEALAAVAEGRWGPSGPVQMLDLGAGGGVPGLVLALRWPGAGVELLEASRRRAAALRAGVRTLDLESRVRVLEGRGEEWARDPGLREHYPLVTARAFGRPAVAAEIAAGFIAVGGALLISEPPSAQGAERWPEEGLATLGFGPAECEQRDGVSVAWVPKRAAAGDRWPRRTGVPAKRPLW